MLSHRAGSLSHEKPNYGRRLFMSSLWNRTALLTLLLCFATANVAIAGVPAVHFGADWRPFDVRTCAVKAMRAMQAQNFIEGTRTPDGAWGFNEQSVVLVRCIPQNQGVYIEVLAASRSSQEAERLRNEIRISVFDARRPDLRVLHPDHFNSDSGAFSGPRRLRNYPPLHWGYDNRPKSLRACMSGAKLAMNRSGLHSSPNGNSIVWGTSSNVVVIVACTPIVRGVSILVAATSDDGQVAERYRNNIRKIAFDSVSFD
jgi:hypothetical protein